MRSSEGCADANVLGEGSAIRYPVVLFLWWSRDAEAVFRFPQGKPAGLVRGNRSFELGRASTC